MRKWPALFGDLLHQQADAAALGRVRLLLCAIWAWRLARTPFLHYANLDPAHFQPQGMLKLLPDSAWAALLAPTGLFAIQALLWISLGFIAAGWDRFRLARIGFVLVGILYLGIPRAATGLFNHGEQPLWLCMFVLCFAPCCEALRLGKPAPAPQRSPGAFAAPLQAMAALLLFCYAVTGIARLAMSSHGVFAAEQMPYLFAQRAAQFTPPGQELGLWLSGQVWLWPLFQASFVFITLMEVVAPLCLVSPAFRWLWLPTMALFHLTTGVAVGICFLDNLLLYPVLLAQPRTRKPATLRLAWPTLETAAPLRRAA